MRKPVFIIIFALLLLLSACRAFTPTPAPTGLPATASLPTATPQPTPGEADLALAAQQIVFALQARDLNTLSAFAHPQKGVRFSPYTYVRSEDLVFQRDQISGLFSDNTIYEWGAYDGSGEPIQLTFADYFESFLYSYDYAAGAQLSYNQPIGAGNTINNLAEFYPGARVVEFYQPGTEEYSGMDWSSLRLVFERAPDGWKLIAIVNDRWTI
ncbi:hypothetical protein [Ornatilinea apprima]|uniref:hypothetical protein n=1 Tax=Ornatilinea apprima TaxID=1134406 RepID=UPI000946329E|nr:hypothetical protein [Ornatilinea apprima]